MTDKISREVIRMVQINLNSAIRAINSSTRTLNTDNRSVEKLASGKRINRAADDAAGLFVTNKLQSKLKGITQAQNNVNDALNTIESVQSVLNVVGENLQKIRELSVQAANGTNSGDELNAIQREVNGYIEAIWNTVVYTKPGPEYTASSSVDLVAGRYFELFQTGSDDGQSILLDLTNDIDPDNNILTDAGSQGQAGSLTNGTIQLYAFSVGAPDVQPYGNEIGQIDTPGGSLADLDTMIGNLNRM